MNPNFRADSAWIWSRRGTSGQDSVVAARVPMSRRHGDADRVRGRLGRRGGGGAGPHEARLAQRPRGTGPFRARRPGRLQRPRHGGARRPKLHPRPHRPRDGAAGYAGVAGPMPGAGGWALCGVRRRFDAPDITPFSDWVQMFRIYATRFAGSIFNLHLPRVAVEPASGAFSTSTLGYGMPPLRG